MFAMKEIWKTTRYTHEFRRDGVRIATASGLTRPQAASDSGVGLSTLNKWFQKHRHDDLSAGPHEAVEKETARLRVIGGAILGHGSGGIVLSRAA